MGCAPVVYRKMEDNTSTMHFVLYTSKTVSQCMRDMTERMQAKPTKTRPELTGWIEKSGQFAIALTAPVIGPIKRTTRLKAAAERERGVTIIKGYVADGISPYWARILFVVMGVVVLFLFAAGRPELGLVTVVFSLIAYIPLRGDYVNGDRLLIEVEKTLKASPTPPKK